MSKHLTVSQVLDWRPDTLTAQATDWDRQANELRSRLEVQSRAVDDSHDTWKRTSGDAMRARFAQINEKALKTVGALEKGRDAANTASQNFTTAILLVRSTKMSAEGKGLRVMPEGTCEIKEETKQLIYSTVNGDAERYSTAISALQVDADSHTSYVKYALSLAADADNQAVTTINAAFADLPTVESFGNGSPTVKPEPKKPPENGTPEENRKYWDALTPEEKAQMISTQPAAIGSLDGIPVDARDQANRNLIQIEKDRIQTALDSGDPSKMVNPKTGQWESPDTLTKKLADLKAVEQAVKPEDGKPPRKLMLLDMQSGTQGRAAIAVGDPDTADHISVTTPGLGTNLRESLGSMVGEADTLKTESERQLRAAGSDDTVSTIAWIGYDPPQKTYSDLDIANVMLQGRAEEAAPSLAKFYEGLDTASTQNDPHITALGHSYGSVTQSLALQEGGHAVDDAVFYGSPGLGGHALTTTPPWVEGTPIGPLNDKVHSAEDLGLQDHHVYEMTEKGDPVANLNRFGQSPNALPWVTHLSTDEITVDGQTYTGASGHAEYPRTDNTTQHLHRSGYNLAAIVAGLPDNATNPQHR
ncbi:alpha/beta hydrolase [Nocardia sp. CA-120079]|uniref:alpha/beta hydrolase n=1 Tax=Nocardia sp. CA-120079 TaxID=3239974 RepID=UPI003D96A88A